MDRVLIGGVETACFERLRDVLEGSFHLEAIQGKTYRDIEWRCKEENSPITLLLLPDSIKQSNDNTLRRSFEANFTRLGGFLQGAGSEAEIGHLCESEDCLVEVDGLRFHVPFPAPGLSEARFLERFRGRCNKWRLPKMTLDNDRLLEERIRLLSKDSSLQDGQRKLCHLLYGFLSDDLVIFRLRSGLSGAMVFRAQASHQGKVNQYLIKLSGANWKLNEEAKRHGMVDVGIEGIHEYIPRLLQPKSHVRSDGYVVSYEGWHAICYQFLGGERFGAPMDLQQALLGARTETSSSKIPTLNLGLPPALGGEADRLRAGALNTSLTWLKREWCANPACAKREIRQPWSTADARPKQYDPLPPYCLSGQAKGWIVDFLESAEAQIGKRLLAAAWDTLTNEIKRFIEQSKSYGAPKLDGKMSMILSPAHGDLNANNVLFFPKLDDRIFLIDFPMYQECGHALQDFARLEVEVKYALMDRQEDSPVDKLVAFDITPTQFKLWCELEDHLQGDNWHKEKSWPSDSSHHSDRFHHNVQLSLWLVQSIRKTAQEVQRQELKKEAVPSFQDEYLCPLLYHTMRSITYRSLSVFKRLLAAYSSAKLLEQAGFTEKANAAGVDSK